MLLERLSWKSGPNTRTLHAILLTLPPSKAADLAHLCAPQNQALGVYRRFVPVIQVYGTHGRHDLVNATRTDISTKTECDYHYGWIKNGHIRNNISKIANPMQRSSWEHRRRRTDTAVTGRLSGLAVNASASRAGYPGSNFAFPGSFFFLGGGGGGGGSFWDESTASLA